MAGRRLDAEERALWRKAVEKVRPLRPANLPANAPLPEPPAAAPIAQGAAPARAMQGTDARIASPPRPPVDTLDGGWDRRLRRGIVQPDVTIDLHGHTLASAHAALDQALARAIVAEARVVLLVTGKPPRTGTDTPRRGLIRAAIGDWLATSRHTPHIAAVRNAHPRHGGAGALYLILRRARDGR